MDQKSFIVERDRLTEMLRQLRETHPSTLFQAGAAHPPRVMHPVNRWIAQQLTQQVVRYVIKSALMMSATWFLSRMFGRSTRHS